MVLTVGDLRVATCVVTYVVIGAVTYVVLALVRAVVVGSILVLWL